MLQSVSWLLPELSLFLMTALATHLTMSFAQTLMHYKLGHHPMGGKFFRNHINFHHTYYSKDHLVSRTYLGDEGNNTPFFFIPVFLVGACTYFLLPFDLFVVQVLACAASFHAHVFFDKEYHVEGSRFQRFAWFRRKQELHFVQCLPGDFIPLTYMVAPPRERLHLNQKNSTKWRRVLESML